MEIITLMMATFNRLDLTKQMLDSLEKSTNILYKFVIVDNASSDNTLSYLKNRFDNNLDVYIIENKENKGIAIARNQALKKADEINTNWYVTLDNDVSMPKGWLEEIIDILKKNPSYAAIGVNMENKKYPIVSKNGKEFQDKPEGNLGTACMVFPKTTHQMLGFFNTEYGKYGEEDADFGMRIRVTGLKLGYIKEMGIHFGEGEADKGEYREFKTKAHQDNLNKFRQNCAAYFQKRKPLYIPFKE